MWNKILPPNKVRNKRSNLSTRGRGSSAGQTAKENRVEEIGGWLILKLNKRDVTECLREKASETRALQPQLHTYMNDVRIGVPVIGAHEKVNQQLSSVFLVQPGDDVLQPPVFALTEREAKKVRKN